MLGKINFAYFWRYIFTLIITALVYFLILNLTGCTAEGSTLDYRKLYLEQVQVNTLLAAENDSLKLHIDYLNSLVIKIDSIHSVFYQESLTKIDSLKNYLAFKDSVVIIMLQSIQTGLENISDQGLANLIELRKK